MDFPSPAKKLLFLLRHKSAKTTDKTFPSKRLFLKTFTPNINLNYI